MSDLERCTFDLDRYQAGAVLAERWGLPPEFRAGIGRFPEAETQEPGGLVVVVRTACRLALSLGFGILGNPQNLDYQTVRQEVPEHAGVSLPEDPKICAAELEEQIRSFDTDRLAVLEEVQSQLPSSGEAGEQVPSTDPAKEVPSGKRAIGWREALVFVVASIFFTAFLFELLKNFRP